MTHTQGTQSTGKYTVEISLPWKKNDKPTPLNKLIGAEKQKKKKTLRPIIYPIFEQCANLTEDAFWQKILSECARGKFPSRGFSFKNNLLNYKKGNKTERLEIPNSASEAFSSILTFFQTVAGIMSAADKAKLLQAEEEKLLRDLEWREDLTWKEIKPEKLKDIMINEFIDEISTKMEYDEEEKRELITIVKKGFILKYFGPDNVILENGKIVEIEGLIYNGERYEIDSAFICHKPSRHSYLLGIEKDTDKPLVDFMQMWIKYLETLENKRIKKNTYSSSYYSTVYSDSEVSESISKTYESSQV
jgi:hypothetical protein